ncbi:Zn-ribbon domain-containing OB-fold protein [Pseudonocardia acaciae]|uniref:Zn-ribbon domain-containing OB-fold protein n=1 Tax=Pseudonocardia acaciae TaxID=551276 RepID=UPI000687944C|nr:OB-fold domain-containing protein [Pseudonocardia acaciae]
MTAVHADTPSTQRPRLDREAGALVGSRCTACGWVCWPPKAGCPRCYATDLTPAALPTTGTLVSWTRVWVPVEGIEPPYLLGMVELGEIRVFAQLRDLGEDATVPAPVRLELAEEEATPQFWFVPA